MSLKSLGKLALGSYSVYAGLRMLGDATSVLMGGAAGLGDMHTVDAPPKPATRGRTGGMTRSHYVVRNIDERVAVLQQLVVTGRTDPIIRKFTVQALSRRCGEKWCVTENDEWAEVVHVCAAIRKRYRYVHDEYGRDLFQAPRRTLELGGGDCLPQGTLLLNDKFEFVPIEKAIIGSRIWGRDSWTEVKDVWFKGILPVDAVFLNNGSSFKATPDHKVYVAICRKHPEGIPSAGGTCTCRMPERSIERITVAQLREGMVLVQPERVAFGTESLDPRRAYIEGLYLSDGWTSHDFDFDIAGRDGKPKEAQKHEVEMLCRELGVETTWFEKSIRVRDSEWSRRVQQMGSRAWNKRALSINLTAGAAAELLRGIMADSGQNTHGPGRTFTTTSRKLMLQTRILHRMLGVSCGERYIVDHGGLGEHPIWRLQTRTLAADHALGRAPKLLRVKGIERDVMELPVYDISTADHYVYLPEADVVVSNCDDITSLICACLGSIGFPTGCRVVQSRDAQTWNHIYALVGLPKAQPTRWVPLDLSVPGKPPGWEVSRRELVAVRDYAFR